MNPTRNHPQGQLTATRGLDCLRYTKLEGALIEALRRRFSGELRRGSFHARLGTADFRLGFLPRHQGFVVAVRCSLAGLSRVTSMGALDRWMPGFVPALESRTHDALFDRDFNVQPRDLGLTSELLSKQGNREVLRQLFERGVRSVHLAGGGRLPDRSARGIA